MALFCVVKIQFLSWDFPFLAIFKSFIAQSAEAVEYTDCNSAEV